MGPPLASVSVNFTVIKGETAPLLGNFKPSGNIISLLGFLPGRLTFFAFSMTLTPPHPFSSGLLPKAVLDLLRPALYSWQWAFLNKFLTKIPIARHVCENSWILFVCVCFCNPGDVWRLLLALHSGNYSYWAQGCWGSNPDLHFARQTLYPMCYRSSPMHWRVFCGFHLPSVTCSFLCASLRSWEPPPSLAMLVSYSQCSAQEMLPKMLGDRAAPVAWLLNFSSVESCCL